MISCRRWLNLLVAEYPQLFKDHQITPLAGVSLVPAFTNLPIKRNAIFWEHEMNRAVRMDKWKLVSASKLKDGGYGHWKYYQTGQWELYNLEKDRSELMDLSGQYPEIVKEMSTLWEEWAHQAQVLPAPWKEEKQPIRTVYTNVNQ